MPFIVFAFVLALIGMAAYLGSIVILPKHVAQGERFAIDRVIYRVVRVRTARGRVQVTVHAFGYVPLDVCPDIAAFQLQDGGRLYGAKETRGAMAGSGCFNDVDVIPTSTLIPGRVTQSILDAIDRHYRPLIALASSPDQLAQYRNDEALELNAQEAVSSRLAYVMAASVPSQVQSVWSFWWRPQPTPLWRTWQITYKAPPAKSMNLVVTSTNGFHEFGLDRYAVVALRS